MGGARERRESERGTGRSEREEREKREKREREGAAREGAAMRERRECLFLLLK